MLKNNTGLLWFDDNPATTLQDKIDRLIHYYQNKYGTTPELCYVHASTLDNGKPIKIEQIEIRAGRSVLPHCFWAGKRAESRPNGDKVAGDPAQTGQPVVTTSVQKRSFCQGAGTAPVTTCPELVEGAARQLPLPEVK